MAEVDVSRLAPVGPIAMLDRALGLAREAGARGLVRAWSASAPLAAVVLGVYYLERVEGVRSLRPLLAIALVLAWGARGILLGSVARDMGASLFVAPDRDQAPRPSALDVFRTSIVAALGLWAWTWLLVLGSLGGALGVALVVPFFCLRGASAPSWIARASVEPQAGFASFVRALADTRGRRAAAVGLELLLLLGGVGLAINLYALTAVGLLLMRSFLGLEVATVSTFLSPTNTFVQLVIACGALILLEPLRAAVAAASFVDARVRAEGLDLQASVERAVASRQRRGGARAAARAAVVGLALASCLPALEVSAQEAEASAHDAAAQDVAVEAELDAILGRSEFQEFEDHRGDGLSDLVERLLEWMMQRDNPLSGADTPQLSAIPLPGAGVFIALGLLLVVAVGVYLFVTRRQEAAEVGRALAAAGVSSDLRERPPETFLDEAAQLAEAGKLREATRALYLATLIALDRRRLISFDPHRTNWQYLREMPRSEAREAFRQFTRVFDHKWYGQEPTSEGDYVTCRALASDIVADRVVADESAETGS